MGSWASGVESVQGSDRGEYLPFGTHDVEAMYGQAIKKRDGSGLLVKARVKILASNKAECKPENLYDICINVNPNNQDTWKLQIADVRSILAAAYDCDIKEVGEPEILFAFPEQKAGSSAKGDAIAGKRFRVVATDIGKNGGHFTKYTCSPFDDVAHKKLKSSVAA